MKALISILTGAAILVSAAALTAAADQQRDRKRDGTGVNCPQNPADCPRYPDCPRLKGAQKPSDQQPKGPGAGNGNGGQQQRKRDGSCGVAK